MEHARKLGSMPSMGTMSTPFNPVSIALKMVSSKVLATESLPSAHKMLRVVAKSKSALPNFIALLVPSF
jgi:hypothetical protein